MTLLPDFHYSGTGGPISGRTLAELARRLPSGAVRHWFHRHEGVLSCDAVEVSNAHDRSTLKMRGLCAVIGGDVIAEADLECALKPGDATVYAVVTSAPEPLDPDVPGGLQHRAVKVRLTTDPAGLPAIAVARVLWNPTSARRDAVPDRRWWPRVLRVTDHPFSRAAMEELQRLVAGASAESTYSFAAARDGEDVSWPDLLRGVFAAMEGRFQERADRRDELFALAAIPDQAERVEKLIDFLSADATTHLPLTLDAAGERLRLRSVLRVARPTQHFPAGGSVVKLDCGQARGDGRLVMAVRGPAAALYRVAVDLDGKTYDAILTADEPAHALLPVRAGTSIRIALTSDATPTAVEVGLYSAEASR